MPVQTNFKKGTDLPPWVWLQQHPVASTVSAAMKYDGSRYVYVAQSTTLYRFDTWTNGWQFLATLTTGGAGQDLVFDRTANVIIVMHGLNLTSWQVFNLNATAVTIANVVCNPWVLTTMTPVLPVAAATGSALSRPGDHLFVTPILSALTAGSVGQTTTNVNASTAPFYAQLVGAQLEVTSGAQIGQVRTISAVVDSNDLTVAPALPGALVAGDTFQIETPTGTATATFNTTTLADTAKSWIVNKYSNMDVEIMSGTGAGQRRRIASNTATVLTLAAAVTGNPRTGVWTTQPDATSTYRIVGSTDFLYYQVGNAATFYKLDLRQTTGAAWVALTSAPAVGGAGSTIDFSGNFSLSHIIMLRSVATSTIYAYDIGLNTWATVAPNLTPGPNETFTTGASAVLMDNLGKLLVYKDLSQRIYAFDFATGMWDVCGNHPYIAGTAVEGKRVEIMTSADGITWLYVLRAGGQEWWRLPLEWL